MNVINLVQLKYIKKISNNKYECLKCNKIFTKSGVGVHYFYNHEKEGIKKKEHLRKISIENNNKPEIKKKISRNTLKAFQNGAIENLKKSKNTKEYKQKCSSRSIKMWQNKEIRKKIIKGIRISHSTKEFRIKMSELSKKLNNNPDSVFQSINFREKMRLMMIELWKDPIERKKRCESQKRSWNNLDRHKQQSERSKKLWRDPKHIEKILLKKLDNYHKFGRRSLGHIGKLKSGIIYESLFEKEAFEYLENNNIQFKVHQKIPNSNKYCDILINNIWIELDGLNRDIFNNDSIFNWNGKIEIYQYLKKINIINGYYIFKSIYHFKDWVDNNLI